MKTILRPVFGGLLALAAGCMAGCVSTNWTGPAITLSGGFPNGMAFGFSLPGYTPPPSPSPVEEAMALLSVPGRPAPDPKQPITSWK